MSTCRVTNERAVQTRRVRATSRIAACALALAFTAATARGQNLLVNGSFTDPPATPCQPAGQPSGWFPSGFLSRNDAGVLCPSDGYYAAFKSGCGAVGTYTGQTVSNGIAVGELYTFRGYWLSVNWSDGYVLTVSMEVRDGTSPDEGEVTAATTVLNPDEGNAGLFSVMHRAGATSLTVVWRLRIDSGWGAYVAVADDLVLERTCPVPITITSVVNDAGGGATAPRGSMAGLAVAGTGFLLGAPSVTLRRDGQPTIAATGIQVAPEGESLTGDFDLTNAAAGLWTVEVMVGPCGPATMVDGLEITSPPGVAVADRDLDGDVDLADFGLFLACFNGPQRPPALSGCGVSDFDGDGDVDLSDFAVFLPCFNGPDRPPACD